MNEFFITLIAVFVIGAVGWAGWTRGQMDLDTISRYQENGKEWCLEELALCTYGPRKVLLRSAIQRINRELDK